MRADAQRNADKLRAAAAEVFRERGLQAPLKEIARRAGVSHGTLYNLFGSREALIDEVMADVAMERLDEVAEQALAHDDAWAGFAFYVERICELQSTDPAISDVVTGRYPDARRLTAVCEHTHAAAAGIIRRAQRVGALRPDYAQEDLVFIFGANAVLARASREAAPEAWRRNVALMLDGLRTEAARPLPVGALTPRQVAEVTQRLSGSS